MRSLPLLPPARPVHLAVHPSKPVLVVACQGPDKLWEIRCMNPVTGQPLLSSSPCLLPNQDLTHTGGTQECTHLILRKPT